MITHTLTTGQLIKLTKAIGLNRSWPKITDDPYVNYAVDCIVLFGDEEPEYDEKLYVEEVKALKQGDV